MKTNVGSTRLTTLLVAFGLAMTACSGHSPSHTREPKEVARSHIEIAVAAISENDLITALTHVLEAEKLDPENADVEHTKAITLYLKNDVDGAIRAARAAIKIDPNHSPAQNTLGKMLLDSGNAAEGIQHLEKAAKDPLFRESYKALTSLGVYHYRRGELSRARIELDQAVQANSAGSCLAHYYLGHLQVKANNLKGAIKSYENATRKACSSFADAHLALAVALERSGSVDLARRKYLEIQEQFPSSPIAARALNRLKALP